MQLKYRALCQRLSSIYEEGEARAIVRWVLEERFSLTRAELLCDDLQHLSMEQQQELEALMQRLEQGEPVQYVLGETRPPLPCGSRRIDTATGNRRALSMGY